MLLWQWFKTIYLFTAPEQFDLPFDPDCSDDFVNDDNAMLILEQARERLANTLKNSDSLDLKTNVFFPVLIALITALIGYLSALYKPNLPIWEQGWNLITPTLSLVLGFLISVIPLMQNLMPMFYEQTGKSPKNLAIDSVLQLEKKTSTIS
jgi:hypothetical protein